MSVIHGEKLIYTNGHKCDITVAESAENPILEEASRR